MRHVLFVWPVIKYIICLLAVIIIKRVPLYKILCAEYRAHAGCNGQVILIIKNAEVGFKMVGRMQGYKVIMRFAKKIIKCHT